MPALATRRASQGVGALIPAPGSMARNVFPIRAGFP
jgi:hypothetical protein